MNAHAISIALCLALLSGCAATPQLPSIRSGAGVSLTVAMAAHAEGRTDISNKAIGDDAKMGAGTGMVAGALWGGLMCGPWFFICAPFVAMVGGGAGALAGATVGVAHALPPEQAAQLRNRLTRLHQSHDLLAELRRNITDRAARNWQLTTDALNTQLMVELQPLQLASAHNGQISFVLRVLVSERPAPAAPSDVPAQKTYSYTSPASPVAVWLDEKSDFVDTSLSSAIAQLSTQIIAELSQQ